MRNITILAALLVTITLSSCADRIGEGVILRAAGSDELSLSEAMQVQYLFGDDKYMLVAMQGTKDTLAVVINTELQSVGDTTTVFKESSGLVWGAQ